MGGAGRGGTSGGQGGTERRAGRNSELWAQVSTAAVVVVLAVGVGVPVAVGVGVAATVAVVVGVAVPVAVPAVDVAVPVAVAATLGTTPLSWQPVQQIILIDLAYNWNDSWVGASFSVLFVCVSPLPIVHKPDSCVMDDIIRAIEQARLMSRIASSGEAGQNGSAPP